MYFNILMLFSFFTLFLHLFCCFYLLKTVKEQKLSAQIHESLIFKKSLVFFLIYVSFLFYFRPDFWILVFLFYLFPIGFFFFIRFCSKNAKKISQLCFQSFISQLICHMKIGSSFKDAYHESLLFLEKGEDKIFLSSFLENLLFSKKILNKSFCPFPIQNLLFLKRVLDSEHQVQDLELLKKKVDTELFFERQKEQILIQSHMQSLILSLLFFIISIWLFFQTGFKHFFIFFIAFLLFSTGTLCFYFLGRKIKWTL